MLRYRDCATPLSWTMTARSSSLTSTTKKWQISQKNRSLLVHIAELSTTVMKLDIKVINASLSQNQVYNDTCNAALNACWDTATARRHWAEQWRHDQVRWRPLPKGTEFIIFSERDLINDDSSLWAYSFSNWLAMSCFSFWKAFLKCPSLSVNGIFDNVRYDIIST